MTIGEQIRRAREKQGMSRKALARLAEISSDSVRKIEDGDTPNPGIRTVKALAEALGIELQLDKDWRLAC